MPIHDWTKVDAGIFHHFHLCWIDVLCVILNDGLLPSPYYALAEQVGGGMTPDVLTLSRKPSNGRSDEGTGATSPAATLTAPQTRFVMRASEDEYKAKLDYALRQRTVVVRHASDDHVVAMIEIVSSGNKSSQSAFQALLQKVFSALHHGVHILLVDLYPTTVRDANGLHAAIWELLCSQKFEPPSDKPLTVVSYQASDDKTAFVEPLAVGDTIPDMPLFLEASRHVSLPLESSYQTAWQRVPRRWRAVLED